MDALVFRLPWNDLLGTFALVLRGAAMVAVVPIYGSEAVPKRVRVGLAVLIAVIVAPVVPPVPAGVGILRLVVVESLVGFVIGFAASMTVEIALYAGGLAGYPTGLAMAAMLDPVTQMQAPTIGIFYRLMGMLVFVAIGGPEQVLGVLARSWEIVPPGAAVLDGPWLPFVVRVSARVITLGFRLAAPIIVTGFLVDLGLMLVNRAVPQMHVLVVGAPIRLGVGLVVAGLSLRLMAPLISETFRGTTHDVARFLRVLAGS